MRMTRRLDAIAAIALALIVALALAPARAGVVDGLWDGVVEFFAPPAADEPVNKVTHMDHLHRAYTYKHRREVVARERRSSGRPRPITSPQAATPGEVALKSEALPLPRPRLGYRAITVEESEALVDWFDHLTGNRTSTAAPSPPDASPW
jgi:hypothetical protein